MMATFIAYEKDTRLLFHPRDFYLGGRRWQGALQLKQVGSEDDFCGDWLYVPCCICLHNPGKQTLVLFKVYDTENM